MNTHVVILAGGLATRLRPYTKKIPKALINIGGKPFIFWQLELLKNQGCKNLLICCGYLGQKIHKAVGDGGNLGINITYSFDGPKLLGTGGAIKKALKLLPDHFMVMYGDTILNVNFKKVEDDFNLSKNKNLIVILKNNNKWAPSNIHFENNKIIKYSNENQSNLNYIDYGLSVFSKKTFENIKENEFNLDIVLKHLIEKDALSAYKVSKRFYEINTIEGVKKTEKYLIRYSRCL